MSAAFLLTYLGLTGVCLGMPRHHAQVFSAKRERSMVMTIVGWVLLTLGLLHSLTSNYWLFGLLLWIGFCLLSGLIIIFSLAYNPKSCAVFALLSVPLLGVTWLQ